MTSFRTTLTRFVLAPALGAALLAGAASAAELRIGLAAPVSTIDPHFANATPNSAFARHIFETLVSRGADGRVTPGLALSWTALEDNLWEFKLRPGVTWHDGQPFTADDVIFTFGRVPNVANNPGSYAGNLRSVAKVEAVDPLTLRITTSAPNPNLPLDLSAIAIVSRHAGEGATTADFNSGKAAIGTGPYRFVSYAPGSTLAVERNADWWGQKQDWDKVSFRIITNPGARTAALLSGDVDMISSPSTSDLPRLRQESEVRIFERQGARSLFLSPDFSRTGEEPFLTDNDGKPLPKNPLLDLRVRQALSLAINRQALAERVQQGMAEPTGQWMPPGAFGYSPEVPVPAQDLSAARRLLAEAGYPDGRNAKTGAPLVLYYDSMVGGGSNPQFDWMRRQLAKIGVQLDVRATDYNRFQDKMMRGSAQIFLWGWNADYPDAENFLFLLYGPNAKAKGGGENAANYASPEYDRLFEQMKFLDDGPEKEQLIARMVAIVQRDAPWMFGYFPMSGGAYQQWVGNAKPTQMVRNTLQYLKIDPVLRQQKIDEWNYPKWWPIGLFALLLALAIWPSYVALKRRERQTAFVPSQGKEHQS